MYNMIYNDDCINIMKEIKSGIIDLIVADPPYFLSNGGKSISSGKIVCVNKGNWDKKESKEEIIIFTKKWINECTRVLKPAGSLFITGTHHNIFDVYNMCNSCGLKIINFITWCKTDPPPLIYKNKFRFGSEHILWLRKSQKHKFNYENIYKINNFEMTDVWNISSVTSMEKTFGKHPTQKPIELIKRMIIACTDENDIVLDPFMGSGTTIVAAKILGRRYIGIEKEQEYFNIAKKRINAIKTK